MSPTAASAVGLGAPKTSGIEVARVSSWRRDGDLDILLRLELEAPDLREASAEDGRETLSGPS